MNDRRENGPGNGLVPAIRDLTDGISDLVRHQIELVRVEVQQEASKAGHRAGELVAFAGVALLGYGLLNFAVVAGAGWWFGWSGLTAASLLLGILHLGLGAWGAVDRLDDLREQKKRIERKTDALPTEEAEAD